MKVLEVMAHLIYILRQNRQNATYSPYTLTNPLIYLEMILFR